MKIKKIQDKLEFDVEAQLRPCDADCWYNYWTGATEKAFWESFEAKLTCVHRAGWNSAVSPLL